jgi:biopolymer transport protein ExbB
MQQNHLKCLSGIALLSALTCLVMPVHANASPSGQDSIELRLEVARKAYDTLMAQIAEEKVPLIKSLNEAESAVLSLRKQYKDEERHHGTLNLSVDSLKKEVKYAEDQSAYLETLLGEFTSSLQSQRYLSEQNVLESGTQDPDASKTIEGQLNLLGDSINRLSLLMKGLPLDGKAMNTNGELIAGHFRALGPYLYFAAEDGSTAGIAENRLNAAYPGLIALPESKGIVDLVKTGAGNIPVDATLGRALKVEQSRETYWHHVQKGQTVGFAIMGLGSLALLTTLFKLFEIISFSLPSFSIVYDILQKLTDGKNEEASRSAHEVEGVAGELLQVGVLYSHEKRGMLEELLYEKILNVRPKLERFLPFLAITAAAAPLMGLLGTVIGMIKTFNLITLFGTGDAKSLSTGISEALVTTELGLTVAIPILILHGMLQRMAKRKLGHLEQMAIAFINGVSLRK